MRNQTITSLGFNLGNPGLLSEHGQPQSSCTLESLTPGWLTSRWQHTWESSSSVTVGDLYTLPLPHALRAEPQTAAWEEQEGAAREEQEGAAGIPLRVQ